jgi:hypothetical protein
MDPLFVCYEIVNFILKSQTPSGKNAMFNIFTAGSGVVFVITRAIGQL